MADALTAAIARADASGFADDLRVWEPLEEGLTWGDLRALQRQLEALERSVGKIVPPIAPHKLSERMRDGSVTESRAQVWADEVEVLEQAYADLKQLSKRQHERVEEQAKRADAAEARLTELERYHADEQAREKREFVRAYVLERANQDGSPVEVDIMFAKQAWDELAKDGL